MGLRGITNNRHNSVIFKERTEALHEFYRKQFDRLNAACEDVMNDIIVLFRTMLCRLDEGNCIVDNCGMIWREIEVLYCKLIYDRVDLNNGSFYTMLDQGSWRRAYTKPTAASSLAYL